MDCGRKPECPEKIIHVQGELHIERSELGFEPGSSHYALRVLTIAPPFIPLGQIGVAKA